MDSFNVPKKVNRCVLKAIRFLQKSSTDYAHVNEIKSLAKWLMRNGVPVANVDNVIKESLQNLTSLGLTSRIGTSKYRIIAFGRMGRALPCPNVNVPGNPGTPLRRAIQNAQKKRSIGNLNPWKPATKILSEDSVSGNEIDKTRKRLRSNTKRVLKTKREVPYPQQEPKQSANIRNEELVVSTGRDFNPLLGSLGWISPNPILPEIPFPPIVCCISSSSAIDNQDRLFKIEVSEGYHQCESPVGLDGIKGLEELMIPANLCASPVECLGDTSERKPDVANASVIGLCGSFLSLHIPINSALSSDNLREGLVSSFGDLQGELNIDGISEDSKDAHISISQKSNYLKPDIALEINALQKLGVTNTIEYQDVLCSEDNGQEALSSAPLEGHGSSQREFALEHLKVQGSLSKKDIFSDTQEIAEVNSKSSNVQESQNENDFPKLRSSSDLDFYK
ncbi:uncharacterized protein LOC108111760 isoform X1 [Drosophila eugracilis]|uniref:uncharacterized protein LOC108111760 isoform X1 n=1 Tax=Drosophila eugracilis TaxID=29029 RepID=UPI001BDB647C|nr:uncharacterized protein LOC108111760 isoform X1 [Drosophila eugracilis]